MTGYEITVGYNSAQSKDDVSDTLAHVVSELRKNQSAIKDEVVRVEGPWKGEESLDDYAAMYLPANEDATFKVRKDEDGHTLVYQCASGGGESRALKEAMRRAFSRLVIQEMHKRGMEVNLNVT
jgi:hypothetical protein